MDKVNNNDAIELKNKELEKVTGGLDVYSDEQTITMYFQPSENPSEKMISIKNKIGQQTGCFLETDVTNYLQSLLDEMYNTGKTYLKINYKRNGEFITEISVNIMF